MADKKKVNILWMYPDILNLHGERGNVKALELTSKKINIQANIDRLDDIDGKIDFDKYDFLIFNCGELKCCKTAIDSLRKQKKGLEKFLNDGKVIFVSGTSGSIFAKKITREDKSEFEGLRNIRYECKRKKHSYW